MGIFYVYWMIFSQATRKAARGEFNVITKTIRESWIEVSRKRGIDGKSLDLEQAQPRTSHHTLCRADAHNAGAAV